MSSRGMDWVFGVLGRDLVILGGFSMLGVRLRQFWVKLDSAFGAILLSLVCLGPWERRYGNGTCERSNVEMDVVYLSFISQLSLECL